MDRRTDIILRVGLAFAFLYPPINALSDPYSWLGYFPPFLHGIVPDLVLLHAFGALEVVIALWLLSGYRILIPATLAFVILLAIVFFNASQMQVVFRDLAISSIALALMVRLFRIRHI